MAELRRCPKCGGEMPLDAVEGLCARCMARVVFGGQRAEVGGQKSENASAGRPEAEERGTIKVEVEGDMVVEPTGLRIGRYKLLEKIGEGGFGVVYMAEQIEPVVRRVALKIIKAGMDTLQVVARFEAERQALALMDHPNIARVLDAGTTERSRPYFVMELVKGIPITDYCDQYRLSPTDRLRLFIQVCHAVQHAHQKGIIHRDLKPSNVLVTLHDGVPVPKVIDFGVAKALGQKLTEKTLFTGFANMIGTPAYMSPEQAELSGLDVDTRSDVYALGVLLYELLTGTTPFEKETLAKAALDEIRRMIRETEPPKPSTRLTELVRRQKAEGSSQWSVVSGQRWKEVRGDLDWIVMKCLEKDRTRRYETANSLALDIEHHLKHEPVIAAAPSAFYRAGKFVRRHQAGLAAAAAIVVLLVAGVVVSTWQAVRATRAERKAQAEASKSKQVAQFLKDMIGGAGASVALGRDTVLLREILDKTAQRVAKDLTEQPEVEADLQNTLGDVYQELGQYAESETAHRRALALRRRCLGNDHPQVAYSLTRLAGTLMAIGQLGEAETLTREAVIINRRISGSDDLSLADSLSVAGNAAYNQGKLSEAEALVREAVAIHRKLGRETVDFTGAIDNLGAVLWRQGKLAEAEAAFREEVAIKSRLLGEVHPDLATALDNLAAALRDEGKLAEAESTDHRVLEMRKKLFGNEHPRVALSLNNLARVLRDERKLAEAETMHQEALAMRRRLLGNQHPEVARSLNNLAYVLQDQGKLAEARSLHQEALALQREALGDEHPDVALSLNNLAVLSLAQGKPAEAEALARDCLAIREKLLPEDWRTFSIQSLLGECLLQQRQYAAAEPLLLSGCQGLMQQQERIPAEHKPRLNEARERLVRLYEATGRLEKAVEWKKQLAATVPPQSPAPLPPSRAIPGSTNATGRAR